MEIVNWQVVHATRHGLRWEALQGASQVEGQPNADSGSRPGSIGYRGLAETLPGFVAGGLMFASLRTRRAQGVRPFPVKGKNFLTAYSAHPPQAGDSGRSGPIWRPSR